MIVHLNVLIGKHPSPMQFLILLLSLFSLTAGDAVAQRNNFEHGFIILDNDTIMGFIERDTEAKLGEVIKYKIDQDQENFREYTPYELNGFGFNTDKIVFETVEVEIVKGADIRKINRFAKVLLKGYTNLYKLQLQHTEYNPIMLKSNTFVYVLKKEDSYYTLGQYEYEMGSAVGINKRYIGMLTYALKDCPDVIQNINSLKFKDQAMVKLVQEYNACASPGNQTENYIYEVAPVTKHGIEAAFTTLIIPNGSSGSVNGYFIGYFWDTYKPDLSKKISARLGVNYFFLRETAPYAVGEPSLTIHAVRIPLAAQLNLASTPKAVYLPFINVGITELITPAENLRFQTYLLLEAGVYARRLKFTVSLDNVGFIRKAPTIVGISVGYRLDKQSR